MVLSIAAQIEKIDQELFLFFNSLNNSFLDPVMQFSSHRGSWIPFYAVLLYLLWKIHHKRVWVHMVSVSVCIFLSDKFSVYIKNTVQRYRPCYNLEIGDMVRAIDGCGGQYGFVSSHAANTFALAFFVSYFLSYKHRNIPVIMFTWATLVSFSRIYLGVHYPLDIAGGAVIGVLSAALAIVVHNILWKRFYGSNTVLK